MIGNAADDPGFFCVRRVWVGRELVFFGQWKGLGYCSSGDLL